MSRRSSISRAIDVFEPQRRDDSRDTSRLSKGKFLTGDAQRLGVSEATLRLYVACKCLDVDAAKVAIASGADLEWEGFEKQRTPLMIVANRPEHPSAAVEIMHMLLDGGAEINRGCSRKGQTALYRATVFGVLGESDAVLMALLGRGADRTTAAVARDLSNAIVFAARCVEEVRQQSIARKADYMRQLPKLKGSPRRRPKAGAQRAVRHEASELKAHVKEHVKELPEANAVPYMASPRKAVRLPPLIRKISAGAA